MRTARQNIPAVGFDNTAEDLRWFPEMPPTGNRYPLYGLRGRADTGIRYNPGLWSVPQIHPGIRYSDGTRQFGGVSGLPMKHPGIRYADGSRQFGGLGSALTDAQTAATAAQGDYNSAIGTLESDTASGFSAGDGSGVIESDQQDVTSAAAALSAANAALDALGVGPASGVTAANVSNVVNSMDPSTKQALLAQNPSVFSGANATSIVQAIQATMANANLTSVQKQALSNQLATLQGGLFSSANMPFLMIGIVAIFMLSKR
jgi:hypothetical protein